MPNNEEIIQDYIEGKLEGEMLSSFLKALNENPALNEEVRLRKEIQSVLEKDNSQSDGIQKLRQTLAEKNRSYFQPAQRQHTGRRNILKKWGIGIAVAASLALIITITGSNPGPGPLPLMTEYSMRNRSQEEQYIKASNAYNTQNYHEAIVILHEIKDADESDATAAYYLGLSHLGNRNYDSALVYIQQTAEGPSIYREDACYFTGYLYYKLQDLGRAKDFLLRVNKENPYYKKAGKILDKIM
ncbi:MAG: hypothetical protein KL787_09500 [Taibaiella sp.]|nr:hypothetical protein [Taibaiella sp.]